MKTKKYYVAVATLAMIAAAALMAVHLTAAHDNVSYSGSARTVYRQRYACSTLRDAVNLCVML